MDKTKHPDWLIIITYAMMAFARAGKDLLSFPDMLICGISGIILGIVVVLIEKTGLPVYICSGTGAFFAALVIIEIFFSVTWANAGVMSIIAAMIPPVAAGAMMVEGLCTFHSADGRKKIVNAIMVSFCLGLAVFAAVMISARRGMTI